MCEGDEKGAEEKTAALEKRIERLEEQLKVVASQVDHIETRIIQLGAGR